MIHLPHPTLSAKRIGALAASRFEKALALCPTDAATLANYAFLLEDVLSDMCVVAVQGALSLAAQISELC